MTTDARREYLLELPWPSSALSPNSRDRWRQIKAKKQYRRDCWILALEVKQRPRDFLSPLAAPVSIRFDFFPPSHRRYDPDNLIARMKSGIDGIVDAGLIADDDGGNLRYDGITVHKPLPKSQGGVRVILTGALP